MQLLKASAPAVAVLAAALLISCGGDDGGGPADLPTESAVGTPPTPGPENERGLFPPLEGPERPVAREEKNYWQDPEYALPDPDDLPGLPSELSALQPPDEPACPGNWIRFGRPLEGFSICYPGEYVVDGHGYVSSGLEERWYAAGFFDFDGDVERGHVSVYVTGPFNQPFPYVAECGQAFHVTLDGHDATVCPDYAGTGDEKIIAYHLRTSDRDYFINAVPAPGEGKDEVGALVLQIAQTFDLTEQVTRVLTGPQAAAGN